MLPSWFSFKAKLNLQVSVSGACVALGGRTAAETLKGQQPWGQGTEEFPPPSHPAQAAQLQPGAAPVGPGSQGGAELVFTGNKLEHLN